MMELTLSEICAAVGGTLLQSGESVNGVTTDSRRVSAGQLFIPLKGDRFDGHAYISAALERGASACLTMEKNAEMLAGKGYILVPDTLLALKALALWYRGRFHLPVVQVTGSAGKTTAKEMIASVLSQRYSTLYTEANYNNAIGTPQTLLQLSPEHQAAVIETGMNHFGEIRYLGEMVRPDFAVITNVGDAHIENLGGTRRGILQAKCEIFECLGKDGVAVLNGDDELLKGVSLPFETVLCGRSENCSVRVTDIEQHGIDGTSCRITTDRNTYEVDIPAPGAYMIYPAAISVAIGERLELTKKEIIAGIASYRSVGSRMRVVRKGRDRIIIDDSYNANPQAMAEALRNLAETKCTRRVAVLGDMGELGELTSMAHTDIGILTEKLDLDCVIAIGPKAKDIQTGNSKTLWFSTVDVAMPTIREHFTEGTAVLIKASHAMEFGKIAKELENE